MSASARKIMAKLARKARGGIISVSDAAEALDINHRTMAMKLAAMARLGWLQRARRGIYFILPIEAEPGQPTVPEDPWVLATAVFHPCYIGGWSAAEHWGLTEQIFKSTLVVTAANIRSRSEVLMGQEFHLFRVPPGQISALTLVWRGGERLPVSGPERTIVDCLRHPKLCGGIRHLADIMREYGAGQKRDFNKLLAAGKLLATGAAWKRMGYLAEFLWPNNRELLDVIRTHLTAGNALLDPAVRRRGKLLRRWGIWVNVPITLHRDEA